MIKSPVGKVQPSPERLAVQMKYMERRYDDVLGKVLEQNALILNSVARMQDDLKTLRLKLESLELSVQEDSAQKVNGDSRLSENGLPGQGLPQTPASLVGNSLPSLQQPFQPPGHFYNPYGSPLYNPYMMMPDPMSYFVNPTMQYAAMYGALSQNPAAAAAPTVEPPKPAIPPFSFGVQLQTPTNGSPNTSNVSLSTPKPAVDAVKKVDNGVPTPTFVPPKQLPVVESAKEVGKISFTPPQQLPLSTSTPKTDSKPAQAQVTPPKPISVIGASTPVKAGIGMSVSTTTSSTTSASTVVSTSGSLSSGFPAPSTTFGFPAKTLAATSISTSSIFSTTPTTATTAPTLNKPFTFGIASASQVDGPVLSSNLNPPKSTAAATKPATEQKGIDSQPKEDKTLAPTIDFSALSSKMCSFGDMKPKNPDANPFGSFKGFGTGTVQPVFGTGTSPASNAAKPKQASDSSATTSFAAPDEEQHDVEEFVPTAEFAPVIPLPPLVEVKKGDENETVLFQHRAKLLRFVKELKEWKERGVGEIKILQAKDNPQKIRVVMWREKVHKIACNHRVTKEIKVTNFQGSPKNLMWTAIDFAEAEEGPKSEVFVCRFGQEEQANEFKKQLEHAVSLVGDTPLTPEKTEKKDSSSEAKTEDAKPAAPLAPLSQLFKKAEGQWTCDACYTDNKKESLACAACTTPKPGAAAVAKPAEVSAPKFTFGFGTPTTTVETAKDSTPKVETKEKDNVFTLKSTSNPAQGMTFGFGLNKPAEGKKEETATTTSSPAPFLDFSKISSTMPSFGTLASNNNATGFFGSTNKGFGSTTVTPVFGASVVKATEPATTTEGDTADDTGEPEFVPTAEFVPVIPLPPLVEVKKGDEDEIVLFKNRAKILRFVKELKEWKERGLGDIKILQAKDNEAKIRVVMWREKVHKIACNHWVTKEISVTNYQGNPKNLMWTAVDFAEGDPKTEIFVCKFGQEERAQEFKSQMEKAVAIVKNAPATPEKSKAQPVESSIAPSAQKPLSELFKKPEGEWTCGACYCNNSKERISCVSCNTSKPSSGVSAATPSSTDTATTEGKNTSDLIEKAERLQLPTNYFTQQSDKPNHPPCRGCEPDTFDFSVLDGRKVPTFDDIPKPQRPQGNETLKDLLTKNTENNKGSLGNAFSSFSFSLPSATTALPSAPSDLKPIVPPFSFVPNFTFSADTNPIVGSNISSAPKLDSNVPTTISSFNDNNEDDNEEEGEEDDDEEDTMFVSEGRTYYKGQEDGDFADHGEGQVKIVYDGDHFCARFLFIPSGDDDDLYVDHLIAAETLIKSAGENTFEWDCVSYDGERASKGRVRANFPDQQAFDSFASAMADSVDIAREAGITEEELAKIDPQD